MKPTTFRKQRLIFALLLVFVGFLTLFAAGNFPASAGVRGGVSPCTTTDPNQTPTFVPPGAKLPTDAATSTQSPCNPQLAATQVLNGTNTLTPIHSLTPTPYRHYPQLPGVQPFVSSNGFHFPSFASGDFGTNLSANGSAHYGTGGTMLLTTNTTGQGGSVWYSSPQLVGKGFDTTFQFKFTNGAGGPAGSGGADGIAFVVQMDDAGPGALVLQPELPKKYKPV